MTEQKIEQFWRNATAEDATNGRHLLARFRDNPNGEWSDNQRLSGWRRTCGEPSLLFYDESGLAWEQCQVYDPVTKDPTAAQKLAEQTLKAVWVANESTAEIEAFKDPSYHTGDLVKVIGPISRPHTHWDHAMDRHIGKVCKVASTRRHPKGNVFYVLDGILTWSFREDFLEPVNPPEIPDSPRPKDWIPTGWHRIPDDEPRLACDAYWSIVAKDWVIIGEDRVEYANRDKWPAIRLSAKCEQPEPQTDTSKTSNSSVAAQPANLPALKVGDVVMLPNGQTIQITKSGFELF